MPPDLVTEAALRVLCSALGCTTLEEVTAAYAEPGPCTKSWTAGALAARCNTCSISPCSAICIDCFRAGGHAEHDYVIYKSVHGGCCDCGHVLSWKPSGCCAAHRPGAPASDAASRLSPAQRVMCEAGLMALLTHAADLLCAAAALAYRRSEHRGASCSVVVRAGEPILVDSACVDSALREGADAPVDGRSNALEGLDELRRGGGGVQMDASGAASVDGGGLRGEEQQRTEPGRDERSSAWTPDVLAERCDAVLTLLQRLAELPLLRHLMAPTLMADLPDVQAGVRAMLAAACDWSRTGDCASARSEGPVDERTAVLDAAVSAREALEAADAAMRHDLAAFRLAALPWMRDAPAAFTSLARHTALHRIPSREIWTRAADHPRPSVLRVLLALLPALPERLGEGVTSLLLLALHDDGVRRATCLGMRELLLPFYALASLSDSRGSAPILGRISPVMQSLMERLSVQLYQAVSVSPSDAAPTAAQLPNTAEQVARSAARNLCAELHRQHVAARTDAAALLEPGAADPPPDAGSASLHACPAGRGCCVVEFETLERSLDILRYVLECASIQAGPVLPEHAFIRRRLHDRVVGDVCCLVAAQHGASLLFSDDQARRGWPAFVALLDCLFHCQQAAWFTRKQQPPPLDDSDAVKLALSLEEHVALRVMDAVAYLIMRDHARDPSERQVDHLHKAVCMCLSYLGAQHRRRCTRTFPRDMWTTSSALTDGTRRASFNWPIHRAACLFLRCLVRIEASEGRCADAASAAIRSLLTPSSETGGGVSIFDPPDGWRLHPLDSPSLRVKQRQVTLSCADAWLFAVAPVLTLQSCVSQIIRGSWRYNTYSLAHFARLYKHGGSRSRELDAFCLLSWLAVSPPADAFCMWLCTFADVKDHLRPVFGISGNLDGASDSATVVLPLNASGVLPVPDAVLRSDEGLPRIEALSDGLKDALTGLLGLFRDVSFSDWPLRRRLRHGVVQCLAAADMGHQMVVDMVTALFFSEGEECPPMLEDILAEVATVREANARQGAKYMLKREVWAEVDPYCTHILLAGNAQQRADDLEVELLAHAAVAPTQIAPSLRGALGVLSCPVTIRVLHVLLTALAARPAACVSFATPLLHMIAMCVRHWQSEGQSPGESVWDGLAAETQSQLLEMTRHDGADRRTALPPSPDAAPAHPGILHFLKVLAEDRAAEGQAPPDVRKVARDVHDLLLDFVSAHSDDSTDGAAVPPPPAPPNPPAAPAPRSAEQASAVAAKRAAALAAVQAQQAAFLATLDDDSSSSASLDDDQRFAAEDLSTQPSQRRGSASPQATAPTAGASPPPGSSHLEQCEAETSSPAFSVANVAAAPPPHDAPVGPSCDADQSRFFRGPAADGDDVCCLCHSGESDELGRLWSCAHVAVHSALLLDQGAMTAWPCAFDQSQGFVVLLCGHQMHPDCHLSLVKQLGDPSSASGASAALQEGRDFLCPMCRRLCNMLMPPVRPDCGGHANSPASEPTAPGKTAADVIGQLDTTIAAVERWAAQPDGSFPAWAGRCFERYQDADWRHSAISRTLAAVTQKAALSQLDLPLPSIWKADQAMPDVVARYEELQQLVRNRSYHHNPPLACDRWSASTAASCLAHWEALHLRPPPPPPAGSPASSATAPPPLSWLARAHWRGLQTAVVNFVVSPWLLGLATWGVPALASCCVDTLSRLRRTLAHMHGAPERCAEADVETGRSTPGAAQGGDGEEDKPAIDRLGSLWPLNYASRAAVPPPPLAGMLRSAAHALPNMGLQGDPSARQLLDHMCHMPEGKPDPFSVAIAVVPHLAMSAVLQRSALAADGDGGAAPPLAAPTHEELQAAVRDAAALVWPIAVPYAAVAAVGALSSPTAGDAVEGAVQGAAVEAIWARVWEVILSTGSPTRDGDSQASRDVVVRSMEDALRPLAMRLYLLHELLGRQAPDPLTWEAAGDVLPIAVRTLRLAAPAAVARDALDPARPPTHVRAWLAKLFNDMGLPAPGSGADATEREALPPVSRSPGEGPLTSASDATMAMCSGASPGAQGPPSACSPLQSVPGGATRPALPRLPNTYHDLYLSLADRPCYRCGRVTDHPALCLLSHRVLCLFDEACLASNDEPLPAHFSADSETAPARLHVAQVCGSLGLFLDVSSSATLCICGDFRMQLPSLYLDAHGEEDFGLNRGRALQLSQLRFAQLEHLWLTGAVEFDATSGLLGTM